MCWNVLRPRVKMIDETIDFGELHEGTEQAESAGTTESTSHYSYSADTPSSGNFILPGEAL